MRKFKMSVILSIIYIVLCILAFAFHLAKMDKFSAMFIGILTMPGSLIEALAYDIIINPIFNIEFNSYTWNVSLGIWVFINAVLIFFITTRLISKKNRQTMGTDKKGTQNGGAH